MGVYMDGWIEVADYSGQWYGAVRTNSIALNGGRNKPILYEIYELSTQITLPADLSSEVLDTHNNTYGSYCFIISWEQIVLANWNEAEADYLLLLELMRIMIDTHGTDKIRLVCWST